MNSTMLDSYSTLQSIIEMKISFVSADEGSGGPRIMMGGEGEKENEREENSQRGDWVSIGNSNDGPRGSSCFCFDEKIKTTQVEADVFADIGTNNVRSRRMTVI